VVFAFDDLQSTHPFRSSDSDDARTCPDCWSDLRDEPATTELTTEPTERAHRHRCTRCGAGWESNAAGWLFPLSAA
jgi:hypothetical protein